MTDLAKHLFDTGAAMNRVIAEQLRTPQKIQSGATMFRWTDWRGGAWGIEFTRIVGSGVDEYGAFLRIKVGGGVGIRRVPDEVIEKYERERTGQ